MTLEKQSPCKVNLILNILGKRADEFHELETVMQPVNLCDRISFQRSGSGVQLSCSNPALPTDSTNLVYRAAQAFLDAALIKEGVVLHLEKNIPMAAGLGGGSGNAATTLLGLNELFDFPLQITQLDAIAASLGSDVPFFLQSKPALATGRGERVVGLENFPALGGSSIFLVHPGFGISTPWAYKTLSRFPKALNGEPGRAKRLVNVLMQGDLETVGKELYNSLEAPALEKFPVLALYQEFLREHGAAATLMSGSGSTTFAIFKNLGLAEACIDPFQAQFGSQGWIAVVPL